MSNTTTVFDFNNIPRWLVILMDIFISILALVLAYFIRFDFYTDFEFLIEQWDETKGILVFVVFFKSVVLYAFKIHKGLIRHTSLEDVKRIFLALLTYSTILFVIGLIHNLFFDGRFVLPTSVLIVEFLASLLFIDRKSTRLNSSHVRISYAVFCLKKKKN